jgi:hypothetical protein
MKIPNRSSYLGFTVEKSPAVVEETNVQSTQSSDHTKASTTGLISTSIHPNAPTTVFKTNLPTSSRPNLENDSEDSQQEPTPDHTEASVNIYHHFSSQFIHISLMLSLIRTLPI